MKTENYLDPEKLTKLQRQTWEIATAHGWHDKPISPEHYCGLIMTEMAGAVEADRKDIRADSVEFSKMLRENAKANGAEEDPTAYRLWYMETYKFHIKGSIEEKFADVVIRILDMAQEVSGDEMEWRGYYPYNQVYNETKSFIENAWHFIRDVLNWGTMNISDSVSFMFDWAQHFNIDLWKHIEWKMKYNELRPYKHGGKKY